MRLTEATTATAVRRSLSARTLEKECRGWAKCFRPQPEVPEGSAGVQGVLVKDDVAPNSPNLNPLDFR